MPDRRTPHRLISAVALAASMVALSAGARAQGGPGYAPPTSGSPPPPTGYAPPTSGSPPPPPPAAPGATPPSYPPPSAGAQSPPVYAPGYSPSTDSAPPPVYAPPPGYTPPAGNAPPPGYTPSPGYAPPPGYGPPGYPPPPRGYSTGSYYPPGYIAPRPPEHLHDGFYLRLHLGGGYGHLSGADGFGNTVTAPGGSFSFGVAIGGAVAPNIIVFGDLFGIGIDPTLKVGGVDAGVNNATATLAGIGAGAAYYFEPFNFYFSGALAFTSAQIDDASSNALYQTRSGIGVQLMIGKEWWLSENWGVGVGGEFIAASMKDKNDSSVTWTSDAFSIVLSATYN